MLGFLYLLNFARGNETSGARDTWFRVGKGSTACPGFLANQKESKCTL